MALAGSYGGAVLGMPVSGDDYLLFLLSSVVNLCPRLPCRVDRVVRSVLRLWAGWCHLVRILALALLRETLKAPFHISKGTVLHREVTWRRQGQSPYHLLDPLGQGLHQHACLCHHRCQLCP